MINQSIASAAFNNMGLNVMGMASGQLASRWASGNITYDRDQMTLSVSAPSRFHAMTGGLLKWYGFGAHFLSDVNGQSLDGQIGVFLFHPQAALRLQRLIGVRYDGRSDGLSNRPVPFYAAIRDGAPIDPLIANKLNNATENDPPIVPDAALAGDELSHGTLSFHDERGLIIDPVAVASLFKDLMTVLPALESTFPPATSNLTDGSAGSISQVDNLGNGKRLHLIDLFGHPWADDQHPSGLRFGTGGRISQTLVDWPEESLSLTDSNAVIRFGLCPQGILQTTSLQRPTFPGTVFPAGAAAPLLSSEFFRVCLVNIKLHLSGNRTNESIEDTPGADDHTNREQDPIIRERELLDIFIDGQSTMGSINQIAQNTGFRLMVSPFISTIGTLPPTSNDRWPAFPVPDGVSESLDSTKSSNAKTLVTGVYIGDTSHVLLSWPQDALPSEAHVRAFPRVDPGPALVPLAELDFAKRGDGTSGIVKSGVPFTLVLNDPFKNGTGPRPSNPRLLFDLLIVTRNGNVKKHLMGGLEIGIGLGGVLPVQTEQPNSLDSIPANQRGVCQAPILGLTPTQPTGDTNPVLTLLGEAAPRESPRFKTMARTETIVASSNAASPTEWNAVLTSGMLRPQSVRGDARLGNPGNLAGAEDYVPGIFTQNSLAQDLARMGLRRTHHLIRRLQELNDARWNSSAAGSGAMAGAVLQNIADTVESPELALLPNAITNNLPATWDELIDDIADLLPGPLSPLPTMIPAPDAGDRWVEEVKRDILNAKNGRRDSQWAWRWAIAHARNLIYVETPLFGSTAVGLGEHEINLIEQLKQRLTEVKNLRLILALPKRIPFGPGYESIAQRFYLARNEAIAELQASAPKRVIAYHPMGFPGRPEVIRGTLAVVDDVWALLGSSSLSRRGLTFDGSTDLAFMDSTLREGVGDNIRKMRKNIMARALGLTATADGETATTNMVRLHQPTQAFELFREILERGGDGLIEPIWPGIPVDDLPALGKNIADPDGREFSEIIGLFIELINTLGPSRV